MRKSIGVAVLLGLAMLPLSGTAMAKRDKALADKACEPAIQAASRLAAPVGLLIGGFDGNGDALVDRGELKSGIDRMFRIADQNRDGALTLIELSEWAADWLGGPSAMPGRFDFDRDQDDRISPAEYTAELQRRFDVFDNDKNNSVDRVELLTAVPPRICLDGPSAPPQAGKVEPRR